MLIDFTRRAIPIREVPIATVYLDENASSHFRPVRDSLAVLRPMLRYVLVSLASFVLDVAALAVLYALSGELLVSAVGARLVSAAVNFALNRAFVFSRNRGLSPRRQAVRYAGLAIVLLAGAYTSMSLLVAGGVPIVFAKLLADSGAYVCGFLLQRGYVFAFRGGKKHGGKRSGLNQKKAPFREPSSSLCAEGDLNPHALTGTTTST